MRRPWMPLYVGDYLAKTGHLTTIQHGAYLLLIMHYWANGSLPTQPEALMAIARMTPEQWSGNCHAVAKFFTNDWRHERIDFELQKVKKVSESRSLAGLKGAWSRHGKLNGH
jgi:uncharacterized protein YdaU (DUF1376 family)